MTGPVEPEPEGTDAEAEVEPSTPVEPEVAPAETETTVDAETTPEAEAASTAAAVEPTDVAATPVTEEPKEPKDSKRWGRRITTGVMIGLAGLLFVLATVAVWSKRTVLSTDRVVAAVDAAAANEEVITALSARVTEELVKVIDSTGVIESILPGGLDRLAPVIEAALTNAIDQQVTKLLSSDDGRQLLNDAVRVSHKTALRLLEGKDRPDDAIFTVSNGVVTLDLINVIVRVVELLQEHGVVPQSFDITAAAQSVASNDKVEALATAFGVQLPENFGQIVVYDTGNVDSSDQVLAQAQRALQIFQRLTVLVVILAVLFIVLALVISVDKRRTALQLGLVIGVLALLLRLVVNRVIAGVGNAIEKSGARAAAVEITTSLTSSLKQTSLILALLAFLVAIIAFLSRPRESGEPFLVTAVGRSPEISRLVVVGFCLLLLAVVGISGASLVVVIGLGIAGMIAISAFKRRATPALTID